MRILLFNLVPLCILFSSVKNEYYDDFVKSIESTTQSTSFYKIFRITKESEEYVTPNTKRTIPVPVPSPHIAYNSKIRHRNPKMKFETSFPPLTSTIEGTQIVYKINDMYNAMKSIKNLRPPPDKEPVFEFNITIPPEIVKKERNKKFASPFVFRMTMPKLNFTTPKHPTLPDEGFLKAKGGKINMFEEGNIGILFRKIAQQISRAFNASSREREFDPVLIIGAPRALENLGLGHLARRRTTVEQEMDEEEEETTEPILNLPGIRLRTVENFTVVVPTDGLIYMSDYTKYFEEY